MKPPPFDYCCPETLEEALALLAEHGEAAKVIAGGQSLMPMLNLRALHPEVLIDINRLPDLDYVRLDDGELRIGALARHKAVLESAAVCEASPLMAAAYPYVSHGPIRNRGTLCGNLCHNDPASEMPAVALASNAEMVLRSTGGTRTVRAAEFFTGALSTATRSDELLVEVRVLQAGRPGAAFHEVSPHKGDFAYVAVGARTALTRYALFVPAWATGHTHNVEQGLRGAAPGDDAFRRAAEVVADGIDPSEDFHADADYRRDLVRSLTRRALADAASRCH